jgi:hypothetical protein
MMTFMASYGLKVGLESSARAPLRVRRGPCARR